MRRAIPINDLWTIKALKLEEFAKQFIPYRCFFIIAFAEPTIHSWPILIAVYFLKSGFHNEFFILMVK